MKLLLCSIKHVSNRDTRFFGHGKTFFFFLPLILLCSCSINGSFRGLTSYFESSVRDNPKLYSNFDDFTNVDVCGLKKQDKIIITNGKNIKNAVNCNEKVLLYLWTPICNSKVCLPLKTILDYGIRENAKVVIISEYYDNKMFLIFSKSYPENIFAVDTKYYKTNLVLNYIDLFFKDIGVNNRSDGERFYYFNKGILVKKSVSLENLELNEKNIF